MIVPTIGIIMAGGSGERFWPVSRKKKPKQLLRLTDGRLTLLEEAVERVLPIIPPERLFVATNQTLQEPIRAAMTRIPPENILAEPTRRNTTGCLAFAAAHLLARYGRTHDDMIMAVTTADHRIGDPEDFRKTIQAAIWYAKEKNALMVVGLHPDRPETGYGYIEIPEGAQPAAACEGVSIFPTHRFREKPSLPDAKAYLDSGHFFWNSGMFFWRMSVFLEAMKKFMPEVHQSILDMRDALITGFNPDSIVASVFEKLPNISIDYAIMEKADHVYMAQGDFPWDDVGLWDSLARYHSKDAQNNVAVGDPILIECQDVTVYNEPGGEKMAVGVLGMKDVIVVTTEDGVLVCPKNRAQDVRMIVERLKEQNASQI
ncbi:MAG: mannose-1-phosphate guanylyltransferase [Candidatus Omnitrophica bacterium]|nr:mannose-1-phosphate guanylyltransferase [Candidatus Omnitrophota bacterium]